MKVDLRIMIGSNPCKCATKTIELSFTPVVGMLYEDGTWKGGGREIIEVTIQYPPVVETPSLSVALAPDESNSLHALSLTYKSHDWKVN